MRYDQQSARVRFAIGLGVLLLANICVCDRLMGQSLPNDECAGAVILQPNVPFVMSTTNATDTGDSDPACQRNFGGGVWFRFTPANTGTVTISTCGSDFDTVLQVYSGSCDALVPVAGGCNDSGGSACPSSVSAFVQFSGIGGQAYWILAGGVSGARGTL